MSKKTVSPIRPKRKRRAAGAIPISYGTYCPKCRGDLASPASLPLHSNPFQTRTPGARFNINP